MPKVKELVKQITDEISSSYSVIQSTYDKWFSGNLTNDNLIEYYGAKKDLCERAWKESHSLPTVKEQKRIENKFQSAWRMYNRLRREKRENTS